MRALCPLIEARATTTGLSDVLARPLSITCRSHPMMLPWIDTVVEQKYHPPDVHARRRVDGRRSRAVLEIE